MAGKTTKTMAKKAYKKRAPRRRLPTNVPEMASLSASLKIADGESNQMYGSSLVQMASFDRAVAVARAYQEYRITSLRWTFKPQFDTFTATTDAATALRVPIFYHMIDKAQAIPLNATLGTLRSMGAKPRRFDDKNLLVTYSPAVQGVVWDGGVAATPAKPAVSPWLNTNAAPDAAWAPSNIDHGSLFYILDTQGGLPGDGQYEYGIELEAQFEFRKPLISVPAGGPEAKSYTIVKD